MKSNIDLTEHKDFNPNNFKVKKVVSSYSDSKGNKTRVPWDKNGTPLSDHHWGYITEWGNYIGVNTLQNWMDLTWTTSSFNNPRVEYDDIGNITSMFYSVVNKEPTMTYDSFSNSYNFTWNEFGTTYSTNMIYTQTPSRIIFLKENTFKHGFRLGSVKDMKLIESRARVYSKYKDSTYNFKHGLKDAIKYPSYDLHHSMKAKNLAKRIFGGKAYDRDHCVYHGYEIYVDYCNVGYYKKISDYSRDQGDYPLTEILDASNRKVKYLYNHKKYLMNRDRLVWHDEVDSSKTIKWPDYHNDYLREIQGLEPMHDWRHGRNFEKTDEGYSRRLLALAREARMIAV